MVGISRDVTAEREAAQRARAAAAAASGSARDEAERQSRLKDEFLATLSHELRTPMNAILGWLSMLASGKPVRDTDHVIAVIHRNAEVQAKLIEDLLDMNRLMSGTCGWRSRRWTYRRSVRRCDPGAAAGGGRQGRAAASTDVQPVPAEIMADNRALPAGALESAAQRGQVHAERRPRRGVGERREDRCMRIAVEDTGQGISPEFLPHVFERFRQEDPSTTRGAWGLGLGLSIAKHLVELHGGDIVAASDGIGMGSSFVVRLPLNAGNERATARV